jgi:uroporphyrinogen decarboxylase
MTAASLSTTAGAMTPRGRAMAALTHRVPDRIPAYVRNVVGWERHAAYFGVATLDELMERLGNAIVSFVPAYTAAEPPVQPGELSPGLPLIWGVPEQYAGTYTDSWPRPLARAETTAEVDAYDWPSASESAWDFAGMREQLVADTTHARMSPSWMPVFSRLCELFGMEQAMVNLHSNRPVVDAALAHLDEFYTEFYHHVLNTCGDQLEIFGIGDDFAGNHRLLIRPGLWRTLFKPLYAKWLGMAKEHGLVTFMHSCGQMTEVLPDLVDIGLDVWQTVQTHLPGQGAAFIKAEYGERLAFVGAIDTTNVLGFATPAEVRAHVRGQILALGEGGGYVCAPDHTVMEEVPPENVAALYDTIAEFRRPGYTLE